MTFLYSKRFQLITILAGQSAPMKSQVCIYFKFNRCLLIYKFTYLGGFGSQSSSSSSSRELPFNTNELDIDRLLSTSPIITESSTTYYDEITDPYLLKPLNGIEPLITDSQKLRSKKVYQHSFLLTK